MRILLLGEALVDLVCEQPVAGLAAAPALVPHLGGSPANTAVVAAREGADVALLGGVGDDGWGTFLRERLDAEGVGTDHLATVAGARTPVSFVTVGADAEPEYLFHGDDLPDLVAAAVPDLEAAVAACDAVYLVLSLLTGPAELEAVMRVRELALATDKPVLLDPNLRLGRWDNRARAADAARAASKGALLVKCNQAEAHLMTGEADPLKAAASLLAGGAQNVVVTLGAAGALLRGHRLKQDVVAERVRARCATGAGDAVGGVLIARLAQAGFYPPAMAAGLADAVRAGTAATQRWGAVS